MKAIKIPCEHDLLSKNHDVWASAVMRCKHGSGDCGSDGYCHAGGSCFADQELTREQAQWTMDTYYNALYNSGMNYYDSSVSNKVFNQNEYTAYRQFRFGITYNFGKQFNIERSKSNQEQSGGKG